MRFSESFVFVNLGLFVANRETFLAHYLGLSDTLRSLINGGGWNWVVINADLQFNNRGVGGLQISKKINGPLYRGIA